jgi:hypothetical protein
LLSIPEGKFAAGGVDLGLGENEAAGGLELGGVETLEVVALDDAQGLESTELQVDLEVVEEGTGSGVELGFLFDEETVHEGVLPGCPGSDRE